MKQKTIGIIFAAGKGSRLAPLTNNTPKPLLKVSHQSLLYRNMAQISLLVDKFTVVVSYLGDQIASEFGHEFDGKQIEYVWQKNPKGGTLDALRTALFYSESENLAGDYLVINADDIHGPEIYTKFRDHIDSHSLQMALSATVIENKAQLKSLGVFEIDTNDNLVRIWEKQVEFISNLANSGIYYLPNDIINYIDKKLNDSDQEHYITTDLFGVYAKNHHVKIISSNDMWLQISTPADLERADKFLKSR